MQKHAERSAPARKEEKARWEGEEKEKRGRGAGTVRGQLRRSASEGNRGKPLTNE
jgi:hypothetical protein